MLYRMKDFALGHLFSIFFMTNIYTCLNDSKTGLKFGLVPPKLEEYLDANVDYCNYESSDNFMSTFFDEYEV